MDLEESRAALPATARRKVLKPRAWEGPSATEIVVYLDPVARERGTRFDVYRLDGHRLGYIESYESSITTDIPGTRLVKHGKRRTFWTANGEALWRKHPSQADAIRELWGAM